MKIDLPEPSDYQGWTQFVTERLQEAAGIKVLANGSVSVRDKYRIEELRLYREMCYWEDRAIRGKMSFIDPELEKGLVQEGREKCRLLAADYARNIVMEGMSLNAVEAEGLFEDLCAFLKRLPQRSPSRRYNNRVRVGNSLLGFISKKQWPSRSQLKGTFEGAGSMPTSTMDDAIDFFKVRHLVRDNQQG